MSEVKDLKLNIGCGNSYTPDDWINIDNSFNAKLSKYPKLRKFLYKIGILPERLYELYWPPNITIIDVRKALPFRDNSVKYVYTSHLLEHLCKEDAESLLKECYRVLKSSGVIRIVVPDLLIRVEEYYKATKQATVSGSVEVDSSPADRFFNGLGIFEKEEDNVPLWITLIRIMQGNKNQHKWVYDFNSLSRRLEKIGFSDIQRKEYLESLIEDGHLLDNPKRFGGSICVEAIKR